jgi:hypothetical protein
MVSIRISKLILWSINFPKLRQQKVTVNHTNKNQVETKSVTTLIKLNFLLWFINVVHTQNQFGYIIVAHHKANEKSPVVFARPREEKKIHFVSAQSTKAKEKKNQNLWSIVAAHKEGNRRTRNGDRRLQAGSGSNTESNTDRISREMTQSNDELDSDTNLLEFSLQTLVRWEEIHSTEIER